MSWFPEKTAICVAVLYSVCTELAPGWSVRYAESGGAKEVDSSP